MSIITAVYADEASLDESVLALHELGVDDGAFSVLGSPGRQDVAAPWPAPTLHATPTPAPDSHNAGVAMNPDRIPPAVLAAVSDELGDRVANDEQLLYYASVLAHGGRILSLRIAKEDVEEVVHALFVHGAENVDQEGS